MRRAKKGFCQCGCKRRTHIATRNDPRWGFIKGQPVRFLKGHHKAALKHGMSNTPEYWAYRNAKQRCTNPNDANWKDYGARGIRFLFDSFVQWFADLGPRPTAQHSADRINNDGHYAPGNLRWATRQVQEANKHRAVMDMHDEAASITGVDSPI